MCTLRVLGHIWLFVKIVSHVASEHTSWIDCHPQPAHRDYFYVGGHYVEGSSGESLMMDQMYVEKLTPVGGQKQPYPMVLIHGKAMTGATWLNTPDGRPGWASYFLSQGYVVYIVDQPTRGRSAWLPGDSNMTTFSAEHLSMWFTATERYNLWPQSTKHTQWPGHGTKGDPIFDAFYSSIVQFFSDDTEVQAKMRSAGAALMDRIGAAILLVHSQAGSHGWLIADARPNLVKGIVAIEPVGPPFEDPVFIQGPTRLWGVTDIPITYEPPVSNPDMINKIHVPSNNSDTFSCVLQAEPARILLNLRHIPVLVEASESSYHAQYDQCTVAFLRQAGVSAVFIQLENIGIKGNGHLQMMEKNNLKIAAVLHEWVQVNVLGYSVE